MRSMIRSNAKLTIYRLSGVFFVLLASIFVLLDSRDTSAYSASISTSNSITLDASPSGDATSIHSESITVTSDCRNGYNLTIATPEGSDLYAGGDNTNEASITAVDGTSALSNNNNTNKWGYTLNSNPTSSTVFSPLSATEATLKTFSQTASPNNDINDTFSIAYGVKIDNTVAPNQYKMANSGAIVYSLTMEPTCLLYTVQYQDNGADNPNGMGTTDSDTGEKSVKQINISEDTKITLLAPNFKKAGYSFLGWSTDSQAYTHFTDNDNTNDPVIYGPMEDVIIDSSVMATANTRNIINMYAVWIPALKDGSNNTIYMQEWDNPNTNLPHDGCSTLTATIFDGTVTDEKGKIQVAKDSVVALTDKRDNEVYTVARLADGNCWMVENLRLEHEGTVGYNINDPTVTNQSLSQGYGGTTGTYGNFVGLADPETDNFSSSSATANSVYKSSANLPVDTYDPDNNILEDIGTTNGRGTRLPRYNNENTSDFLSNPSYTEDYSNRSTPLISGIYNTNRIFSYGNYYNWPAAIANTSYYSSPATSEITGTSICPSGWHLPSSNGIGKEYGTLSKSYGGNGENQTSSTTHIMVRRFRSFPNNYIYSGWFPGSSSYPSGFYGSYWSRSTSSRGYYLDITNQHLAPSYAGEKSLGFALRCTVNPNHVEIVLNSNNNTGTVSRLYSTPESSVTLPSSSNPSASIAQPHYTFQKWNTAPDGSGTSYTSSYSIPAGSTGITLYAQWVPQRQIIYNDNCSYNNAGCTSNVDTTNTSPWTKAGSNIALASNSYFTNRNGYYIASWNTNRDGSGTSYNTSTNYTVPSDLAFPDQVTLYAQWIPYYTVTYINNCMTWASSDTNCTQDNSDSISTQRINLNTSGNGSGKLAASNKWTNPTGWKIQEWTTNADGSGTAYPASSTYAVTGASAGDSTTLYAHWVPVYSIQYDGNGADNPNGMGTTDETTGLKSVKQTNVGEGDPVTLLASNFKKAGNGFAGWSTDPDAWSHFTDNDSTNDPIIYGPMETISAPAYPNNGTSIITMYAVWVPAEKDGDNNSIYLQEWDDPADTTDGCTALTSTTFNSTTGKITASKNSIIALADKRDNEVYAIAKLADDNCWMIENLRLEHEGTVGNNINDPTVTNESLSQGYGGTTGNYGNFVGLATTESAIFSSNTANSIYKSDGSGDTYNESANTLEDIGVSNYPGYRFPRYNNNNTKSLIDSTTYTKNYSNTGSPSESGTFPATNLYSYGNYYTWAAAMANTNYYTSSSTTETAGTSICPSGWHLPSSNGINKEYGTLSQRYGGTGSQQSDTSQSGDIMSSRFRAFPNNFLYSGHYSGSSASSRGSLGYYWSRSASNYDYSYNLNIHPTSFNPSSNFFKYYGYSVRCMIGG